MNILNKFTNNTTYNQKFFISLLFVSLLWVIPSFIIFLSMLSVSYSDAFLFLKVFSLLGLILIISFSLLITISFNDIKKSEIFWKKAIDFEKLIKDSKTKNVLEGIFKNEFEELKSLFIGPWT